MFTDAVGCLYTGDFCANDAGCLNQLKRKLEVEWATIGCVQIPHHGSKYNYNNEFLSMSPWHVASAGKRNKTRHPHKEVRDKYNGRCPLIVVTEGTSSLAEWRIEEKSSIASKAIVSTLNGATIKRWYKGIDATATFKIEAFRRDSVRP